jgi:uncharacterized RDD family membrane protein YckC
MKCPKCGYLGFEHVDRCRNCGYEFSLSLSVTLPDLRLRNDSNDINPPDDLRLTDEPTPGPSQFGGGANGDLDVLYGAAAPPAPAPVPSAPARPPLAFGTEAELPLFGPPITDDVPLITKASPPRPPLAVRRSTPDMPRLRAPETPRTPSLDLTLDLEPPAPGGAAARPPSTPAPGTGLAPRGSPLSTMSTMSTRSTISAMSSRSAPSTMSGAAGFGPRIAAAAIDLLILAAIDAAVVYFTLKICGLGLADLTIVPKGPLLAFLLVQNGSYLVAFTVTGQTLGKMAAGIKVIPAESDARLDIDRALLRTFLWLVLAVPAGLGFLSALFSSDHRGLHDRFARTRVVRASA